MGATGWSYFVPYQADINAALQALRQDVFESGKYFHLSDIVPFADDIMNIMPEGFADMLQQDAEELGLDDLPEPTTIEELLELNAESGTHSILDIEGISATPGFASAAPLSVDQLLELFGTEQPNHAQVEAKIHDIYDLRERWQGTYVIVYKDREPEEILFVGYSGD
ncbi:MAG: hypothetical protein GYB65_02275 [Chloroflexi bacterium]|nr:hypothetical protein [Chloroflexota bacterium]